MRGVGHQRRLIIKPTVKAGAGLPLPVYASAGAAGMDICAAEAVKLKPGARFAVPTGFGVAIPHGRIKGLKSPMAAVFQLAQPIGFDAPDELPVNLLIFLLVPEAATQKHLEILSEIAELLSDSALRENIKGSASQEGLHQLIAQWRSAQTA